MNLKFLQELSKSHPSWARTIEIAIISAIIVVLTGVTSIMTGQGGIEWNMAVIAFLTPILAGLSKYNRSLQDEESKK